MTRCNPILRLLLTFVLISISALSTAEEPGMDELINGNTKKSDRNYVSFGIALNEFRSIKMVEVTNVRVNSRGEIDEDVTNTWFPVTAQTYATSITLGTYITDYVRTELRYGMGIRDDTVKQLMDININYWFNWYIGATYPVTDYMSAYVMGGVSHYEADITRHEIKGTRNIDNFPRLANLQPSRLEIEDNLFGTSFSPSWLLGLDFGLGGPWFLAFEYGRLLRDTDTNIKVYQAGSYLRYEF